MGLLDDAIREHLELKRLRGADPSEVILEERDALGAGAPIQEDDGTAAESSKGLLGARISHPFDGVASVGRDISHLSQETVELDMRSLLEEESIGGGGHEERCASTSSGATAPSRASVELSAFDGDATGDSLEWEVPGERKRVNGRLREEGSPPVHRVLDARNAPVVDGPAGFDSESGMSLQELLWLDRQPAPDLGIDR